MATGAPRRIVNTPSPVPSRLGLLSAALMPNDGDDRWMGGFAYMPTTCSGVSAVVQCGAATNPTMTSPTEVGFTPIVLFADDKCSARSFSTRDFETRVRQKLEAGTGRALEREFWMGTIAQAQTYSNDYLAKAGTTMLNSGTTMASYDALGCLEQYAADTGDGLRAMIHATRKTVTLWAKDHLVRREGNLLLTAMDTIVVAGVGYPGTKTDGTTPTGGDAVAYVTDMVSVRLSPVEIYDNPSDGPDGSLSSFTNKADNTIRMTAFRYAAATFDGCRHAGVLVDLAAC